MTAAVILGMIVTMFPEPREQAKAIGVYGFVASAGGSIGLLVGGVLTQAINWHWIFFVNIPIGIATAVLAMRYLEQDKGIGLANGADVLGAVLVTSALMLLVYTIVDPAAELGWGAERTLVLFGISLTLLAAFLVREATAKTPLIPLRIFRSRNVSGANLIQVVSVAGMFSMFFLGSLYMQRVLGYDALQIGLAFLPATVIMGVLSLGYSHKLVMKYGAAHGHGAGVRAHHARAGAVHAGPGQRRLRHARPADDGPVRDRRRPRVPGAHDDRDVRRRAERRRPGLGSRQHDRAGRRRARPGPAGDARDDAHRAT